MHPIAAHGPSRRSVSRVRSASLDTFTAAAAMSSGAEAAEAAQLAPSQVLQGASGHRSGIGML